jgi:formimidoylglutamate deiminase
MVSKDDVLSSFDGTYSYGGFDEAEPESGQKRFLNDPERFSRLVERSRAIVAGLPHSRVGIAPHSLRAVTPGALRAVVASQPDGPIHIHAAEQVREVDECIASLGSAPVQWLLDNFAVDRQWCLIHPTGGRLSWFSTPIIHILQLARGIGSTRFCSLEAGV